MNWPTPVKEDSQSPGNSENGRRTLPGEVKAWGTPRDSDHKDSGDPGSKSHTHMIDRDYLCAQVKSAGESLNPRWEEILMGWPLGWTDPTKPCTGVWPGFPMGQGPNQRSYEPPRTVPKGTIKNRTSQVEMCGNGVVPQQAEAGYYELLAEALA